MNLQDYLDKHKGKDGLTMGDLREFVHMNSQIPSDTPVVCERIEDFYFEKNGWDVYKHKGFFYNQRLEVNKEMEEEIIRRENGEEPEYDIEDPSKHISNESELELCKEQFFHSWCISNHKNELVLIYNHI